MVNFDAILEMNWLSKNNAMIDFKGKNVRLKAMNQEDILYHAKIMNENPFFFASPSMERHEI